MAEIKVEIDGDDVNKVIAEAIIKSSIGAQLQKSVATLMEKNWEFQRDVDAVVRDEIRKQVSKIIQTPEIQDKIRAQVKATMTDELVSEVTSKVFQKAMDRY